MWFSQVSFKSTEIPKKILFGSFEGSPSLRLKYICWALPSLSRKPFDLNQQETSANVASVMNLTEAIKTVAEIYKSGVVCIEDGMSSHIIIIHETDA